MKNPVKKVLTAKKKTENKLTALGTKLKLKKKGVPIRNYAQINPKGYTKGAAPKNI